MDISPIFLNPRYEEDGRRDYQAVKMKLGLLHRVLGRFLLLTTVIEQLFTPVSTAARVQRARQAIYQQCVLGDRETRRSSTGPDAAPDDNSDLASGGHDDDDIMGVAHEVGVLKSESLMPSTHVAA